MANGELVEEVEEELAETEAPVRLRPSALRITQGGEIEDLLFKRNSAERAKISLPETLFLLMITSLADLAEFLGDLTVILGILTHFFGLLVSGFILLWSLLRDAYSVFFLRRLLIILIGAIADAATLGFLPLRTASLAIAIWLNNRSAKREIKRIDSRLEELGVRL